MRFLAERGADRSVLKSVPAMLAGEVVIYAVGMTWLALDLHLGASATIAAEDTPFLVSDAIKAAIAAELLPAAWKIAGRRNELGGRRQAAGQDVHQVLEDVIGDPAARGPFLAQRMPMKWPRPV